MSGPISEPWDAEIRRIITGGKVSGWVLEEELAGGDTRLRGSLNFSVPLPDTADPPPNSQIKHSGTDSSPDLPPDDSQYA